MQTNKLLLGIDFGTSTNFVTKYDFKTKTAVAVANMGGYASSNIFENCIYIANENSCVLGKRDKIHADPENFFDDIKRYITDDNKKYIVPNLDNKTLTPIQITQLIFETIKKKVEENENRDIDGVVVTVPYSYSKKYRERVQKAVEDSGLRVIRLIEEPVAAAISYGLFEDDVIANQKEKIVVFDLGGGTFDITIFNFEKSDNQHAKIEVLNTDGVEKLGGKTIDEILVKKFMEYLKVDWTDFANQRERIKFQQEINKVAKETKENLSEDSAYDVYQSFYINGEQKELDLELKVEEFNQWLKNNNVIGEIEDALDRAIYDIDLSPDDIDRVVLVGGTSNIPLIKELVSEFFGEDKIEAKINLGELVGSGAGILAGLSEDETLKYEVIRKTSKDIGIAVGNRFKAILYKNSKYGEQSPLYPVKLQNKDDDLIVYFYESDSSRIEDSEKIGKVEIEGSLFNSNKLYISLEREDKKESKIKVYFYDENKNIVVEKFVEDV